MPCRVSKGKEQKSMENTISYIAGGEKQTFPTCLCIDGEQTDLTAKRVFLAICKDRDSKLVEGQIRRKLTEEEEKSMAEEEIFEWYRITFIEFVDYASKKKLIMNHMSDFSGNYTVESI